MIYINWLDFSKNFVSINFAQFFVCLPTEHSNSLELGSCWARFHGGRIGGDKFGIGEEHVKEWHLRYNFEWDEMERNNLLREKSVRDNLEGNELKTDNLRDRHKMQNPQEQIHMNIETFCPSPPHTGQLRTSTLSNWVKNKTENNLAALQNICLHC